MQPRTPTTGTGRRSFLRIFFSDRSSVNRNHTWGKDEGNGHVQREHSESL